MSVTPDLELQIKNNTDKISCLQNDVKTLGDKQKTRPCGGCVVPCPYEKMIKEIYNEIHTNHGRKRLLRLFGL